MPAKPELFQRRPRELAAVLHAQTGEVEFPGAAGEWKEVAVEPRASLEGHVDEVFGELVVEDMPASIGRSRRKRMSSSVPVRQATSERPGCVSISTRASSRLRSTRDHTASPFCATGSGVVGRWVVSRDYTSALRSDCGADG